MATLTLLGLAALAIAVGHLVYRAFAPREQGVSWGELLWLQSLVGVLLCGWLALLLAELGLFSLPLLVGLLLVAAVAILLLRWPQVRRWACPRWRPGGPGAMALTLLLGAALLYARPTERILGGNDPAVYLATAASIAHSGGIVHQEARLAALPPDLRSVLLSDHIGQWWLLPGFYVTDLATGQVTPQFLHLYPTWLALFYAVGGLPLALGAVPLFMLLGLASFFFLARRLVDPWAALPALALLALNPALVWFGREPNAEALAMALLLGGWYLFDRAMREDGRRDLAVLAGLCLGQLALAKIEFVVLPALLALYFLVRAARAPLQPRERAFLCTYGLVLLHGVAHMALVARPYLRTFITSLVHSRLGSPALLGAFLLGAAAALVVLWALRRRLARPLEWLGRRAAGLRWALALSWLGLALYGALAWPLLAPARILVDGAWLPYYERLTFLRLSWYLGPLGLVLAVLGLSWWLRRLNLEALPFVGAFFFEFSLLIHRTMDYPYHFWMMRRYIPLIFPLLALGAAAALWRVRQGPLGPAIRRGGAALLLGLLLLPLVAAATPLAARPELPGTKAALAHLAGQIPGRPPLLIAGLAVGLATPLRYHWGLDAYALPEPPPWEGLWTLLQGWPPTGEVFLLLGTVPSYWRTGMAVQQVGELEIVSYTTEETLDYLPREAVTLHSYHVLWRYQRLAAPTVLEVSLEQPFWTGACLAIHVPGPEVPLRLSLRAAGFRPENVPPAVLSVTWDGVPVAETALAPSYEVEEVVLLLSPPSGRPAGTGDARLELCVETWNPRASGYNDDARDLGIMLQTLRVEPAE